VLNKRIAAKRQQGFSLLEILVAFSILALSLGILLNIFSSGIRTAMTAEEYSEAVQIAQSLLASTSLENALQAGETQGVEYEKYNWSVLTQLYESGPDAGEQQAQAARLYQIIVSVSWGGDSLSEPRTVELNTLRFAAKP